MSKKRYILKCSKRNCGASTEDIRKNPKAWNGWIVIPQSVCPACVARDIAHRPTHQLVELRSQSGGKVISTLVLAPIEAGRTI